MKDVSIILPSIRPQYLVQFYNSILLACKKYTFEIVIPTPFDVPDEIKCKSNVKIIRTYTTPTVAKQIGILHCNAEYLYNTTDDGFILPDSIDKALDMFKQYKSKDVINMIYNEQVLDKKLNSRIPDLSVQIWPTTFWNVSHHQDLNYRCLGVDDSGNDILEPLLGVDPNWKISLHFFMKLSRFIELGGLDCKWEYSNHAIHDLMFRNQADGGSIYNTDYVASAFTHFRRDTYDHKPVHDAQVGPDTDYFNSIYSTVNAAQNRIKIDYNNWKEYDSVWTRRFNEEQLPITREEYDEQL